MPAKKNVLEISGTVCNSTGTTCFQKYSTVPYLQSPPYLPCSQGCVQLVPSQPGLHVHDPSTPLQWAPFWHVHTFSHRAPYVYTGHGLEGVET